MRGVTGSGYSGGSDSIPVIPPKEDSWDNYYKIGAAAITAITSFSSAYYFGLATLPVLSYVGIGTLVSAAVIYKIYDYTMSDDSEIVKASSDKPTSTPISGEPNKTTPDHIIVPIITKKPISEAPVISGNNSLPAHSSSADVLPVQISHEQPTEKTVVANPTVASKTNDPTFESLPDSPLPLKNIPQGPSTTAPVVSYSEKKVDNVIKTVVHDEADHLPKTQSLPDKPIENPKTEQPQQPVQTVQLLQPIPKEVLPELSKSEKEILKLKFKDFPLNIRRDVNKINLLNFLKEVTKTQLNYLISHRDVAEKFWTIISNEYYRPIAANALNPENFFFVVNNAETSRRIDRQLNEFVCGLNSTPGYEDLLIDQENIFVEKIKRISKTGHPALTLESLVKNSPPEQKNLVREYIAEWKRIRKDIIASYPRSETPPGSPAKALSTDLPTTPVAERTFKKEMRTVEAAPLVRYQPAYQTDEHIKNFIEKELGSVNKELCYQRFEEMDDDSLVRFVKFLGHGDYLLKYLNFEKIAEMAYTSVKRRQARLQLVFGKFDDDQIKHLRTQESFWELITLNFEDIGLSEYIALGLSANHIKLIFEPVFKIVKVFSITVERTKKLTEILAEIGIKFPVNDDPPLEELSADHIKSIFEPFFDIKITPHPKNKKAFLITVELTEKVAEFVKEFPDDDNPTRGLSAYHIKMIPEPFSEIKVTEESKKMFLITEEQTIKLVEFVKKFPFFDEDPKRKAIMYQKLLALKEIIPAPKEPDDPKILGILKDAISQKERKLRPPLTKDTIKITKV
jgi:hypothetical protein